MTFVAPSAESDRIPRGLLIGVGLALALAVSSLIVSDPRNGPANQFPIGLLLGTCWGITTFSAAWFVLGSGGLVARAISSLLISAAILGGLATGVLRNMGMRSDLIVTMAVCVFAQFLLLQIPLWVLRGQAGLHLTRRPAVAGPLQFGIRQLLMFTAVIGVVLGAGRMVVTFWDALPLYGEAPIFAILTSAAIITTLPLVLALFIRSYFVVAVVVALAFISAVVPAQLQLLAALKRPGPDLYHLIWINVFQAGWILVMGGMLRGYGFRLVRSAGAAP